MVSLYRSSTLFIRSQVGNQGANLQDQDNKFSSKHGVLLASGFLSLFFLISSVGVGILFYRSRSIKSTSKPLKLTKTPQQTDHLVNLIAKPADCCRSIVKDDMRADCIRGHPIQIRTGVIDIRSDLESDSPISNQSNLTSPIECSNERRGSIKTLPPPQYAKMDPETTFVTLYPNSRLVPDEYLSHEEGHSLSHIDWPLRG
ncbi:uncharacterized protein MELLADRAFT_112687 [Melampsora larici-populina 98AG31]|uniref:Uncharacterized protein n=1 Tax=Melampsora larici-populina (strain 98AG31 / pathotype 3-4-7) TaxID=747676 RepID=F4S798_MELLP|nr:uncharacterized protein MELLADRAFT_112687 [Melampsora larici-populina 98AG31]EGF99478.1 hypothetical protein MELLADRAFT_112687 [Melampsora larici-populina 98AG31]